LEQLEKDGLISYNAQDNDLELTFLVPREDDITINAFIKKVEELHKTKTEKLDSMLAYVQNEAVCRNKMLLSYFGEEKENCEKCDICKSDEEKENSHEINRRIVALLKESNKTSRKLIEVLGLKSTAVIEGIQYLLEDGLIQINSKNEYEIKE